MAEQPSRFADTDLTYMTPRQSARPRFAAFGAGWAAAEAGEPRESPHPAGSEADTMWLDGYATSRAVSS